MTVMLHRHIWKNVSFYNGYPPSSLCVIEGDCMETMAKNDVPQQFET